MEMHRSLCVLCGHLQRNYSHVSYSLTEHEATLSVKTEFMQCWEGIETQKSSRILVMGATNRPHSLDAAVLRRFSLKYEIGLPDEDQRCEIMKGYIEKHILEAEGALGDVYVPLLDNRPVHDGMSALEWIAQRTTSYSGSDLRELCAQAAQRPVQDAIREEISKCELDADFDLSILNVRQLELSDFEQALKFVQPGVNGKSRSASNGGSGSW